MNKFLSSILIATVGIFTVNAQTKVMKIEYKDGSSEVKNVADVSRITFGDQSEDPSDADKMVDLGLSVKWASYNIGASNPWEYGNFYAYGEIEPKTEYNLKNYQWYYDNDGEDHDQWEEYLKLGATFTGTNYDVAHVKWGNQWRVPTRDEWTELINNCEFEWTGMNGVTGAKITSRINGNSIFLPAAGNMVDAEHTHDQLGCFYWTSSEFEQSDITQECRNYRANIDATNHSANGYDYPEVGFSIRAVYGPVPEEELPSYTAPEMVDLGLSVKWANCNLGAKSASETGDFICWGELMEKQYSHKYNYKWYDPLTDKTVEIGDQISDTQYDAAKAILGDGWRLPTEDEMKELLEKCTWTEETYGFTVTGPNGNSIYLPACGFQGYKGAPRAAIEPGYYMTGNSDVRVNYEGKKMIDNAVTLRFTRGAGNKFKTPEMNYFSKAGGIQIRPVHK